MITKEEYLKALEIVENYHQQIHQNSAICKLTRLNEWDKLDKCSVRLRNILFQIMHGSPHQYSPYKEEYIENIKLHKMKRVRNCGTQTLNEFIELRGY